MNSSGCAVAWRGRLADDTETAMGDRDLTYDEEIPSPQEMLSTKDDFREPFIALALWLQSRRPLYTAEVSRLLSIEISTEDEWVVPDLLADHSLWFTPWQQVEPDPTSWRGVFSPPHRWKVVVSEEIDLKTTTFRRLKPGAIVDRRTLSREEDA